MITAVPKPSPRTAKPKKPVKRVNVKRSREEFARCYGSKERVEWVKAQPCTYCVSFRPLCGINARGTSHNAHTVSGGRGRKADYTTVISLCERHHRLYDDHIYPFDRLNESIRQAMKDQAGEVEKRWQLHLGQAGAGTDENSMENR